MIRAPRGFVAALALVITVITVSTAAHAQSILTVAGGGTDDGLPATQVGLYGSGGIAFDRAGNLYLAESSANHIRRIDVDGTIHTVAGSGGAGFSGDGSTALRAALKQPVGVAVDAAGNVYVADRDNDRIRRIDTSSGIITTLAGGGEDRPDHTIDGAAAGSVLKQPFGLWLDGNNLYVTEIGYNGNRIRRIDLVAKTIVTVAGALDGTSGYTGDGGPALGALLSGLTAVAVDGSGNIYLADNNNNVVRRIDGASKTIDTYAGGGTLVDGADDDVPARSVAFTYLGGLAFDGNGNLLVAQTDRIRRIDKTTGKITTAGRGSHISYGLAVASDGSIFADTDEGTVLRFSGGSLDGVAVAGGGSYLGDGLLATAAVLRNPTGLAVTSNGTLYIADSVNTVVRRVDPSGVITTYAGITGQFYQDGGDGEPATKVAIGGVADVALDSAENLYIADPHNNRIKKVDANTHLITTVAGGGDPPGGNNEGLPAKQAILQNIRGVSVDRAGNLFIAAQDRIWRVDAATQTIRSFAGTGSSGFSGDGGLATAAALSGPTRAVADPSGNVIIADSDNGKLRKVTPDGKISTIFKGGDASGPADLGDGGNAVDAAGSPAHFAVDSRNGDIYFADRGTMRLRKIESATGKISTIAGSGITYQDTDFAGDDGRATDAKMNFPFSLSGVAVDRSGNVFLSDSNNNRVRAVFACTSVTAPVLSAPADAAQTSTAPSFSWSAVPGAFRYDVRIDTSAQPSRVAAADLSDTSFTPSNLAPGTKYYWQVVAKGDPFCPSRATASSSIRSFTTAAGCGAGSFDTISPADGAGNAGDATGVVLTWQPSVGATTYDVYAGGTNPPPLIATTTATSYKAVVSGLTYWFVVAHATCDPTKTASTRIRSFSTNAAGCAVTPTIAAAAPAANAVNVSTTVDLSWTANTDFDSFEVYFGTAAQPPLLRGQIAGNARSITLPALTTGTTYFWRVVGKSQCLQTGAASTAVFSFTTRVACVAPSAPVFQFLPRSAATGSTYAIVWSAAAGLDADGAYLVERSSSASFSGNVESQVTTSAAAAFVATSAGTFYHRVRALPGCDPTLAGPPSDTRSVEVIDAPPNVIFTLQPRAVVSSIGDHLEDHPTTFALENLSASNVQVFIGQQELGGSPPFFRIAEDSAFVTLEPRKPKTFTIRFGGPPNNVQASYQAVIFVASTGTGLALTPYTFVNLKVGGGVAATPQFEVDGVPSDYAAFKGFGGDDTNRPPLQVTIRNPGAATMDLAAEIGPEAWLIPENGWNAPLPGNSARTINLFTRRTFAPNGSALPRYTYFTVRTKDGTSARLLVQDNDGIAVNTGRATNLAVDGRSFVVPELASATSQGGHRLFTRLRLTNLGGDSVQAELIYTPAGSDGFDASAVQRVVVVVPANDVVTITNPAEQLFGKTAPQSGQLEVRLPKERVGLVSVRASIVVPGGRGGFETPVVRRGDGARLGTPQVLALLPQSNVALVLAETSGGDSAAVRLTLYDASGNVSSTQTQQLARYGMVRLGNLTATRIDISVESGGGSVIGVATIAAPNGESGATLQSRAVDERIAGALAAQAMWKTAFDTPPPPSITTVVPVLTTPASAGAAPVYSTAISFLSSSSAAATFSASLHNSTGIGPVPKVDITVPAGGSRTFNDAAKEMFGNAGAQGSVFVSAPPGAKVFAVLQSVNGTTFTPIAALPLQTTLSDAITGATSSAQKPLQFDGLEQSLDPTRGGRWLVILNEVGGSSGVVRVRLYEAGNRNVAIAQKDVAVGPYQQLRLDTVFSELGLDAPDRRKDRTNVQIVVTAASGGARVTASAMSVDNVSGDTHVFALQPVVGSGTPNVVAVAPVVTAPAAPAPPRHRGVRH